MNRHTPYIAFVLLLLFSAHATALDTLELIDDPDVKTFFEKNCIRADTAGIVPVDFDVLTHSLIRPDLLPAAQQIYARSVAPDGKIKFPIIQDAPNSYHYVNSKKQRTDIRELMKKSTDEETFDIILHASGKRFFGRYDAIIHIRFFEADAAGVIFVAQVHAYPHNRTSRFFVRSFRMLDRYFKKKTATIEHTVKTVAVGFANDLPDDAKTQPKQVENVYPPRRHSPFLLF